MFRPSAHSYNMLAAVQTALKTDDIMSCSAFDRDYIEITAQHLKIGTNRFLRGSSHMGIFINAITQSGPPQAQVPQGTRAGLAGICTVVLYRRPATGFLEERDIKQG